MNILISACLLGVKCRYDGKGKTYDVLSALPESIRLIPVCPEQLGGLSTPRPKAEIKNGRVINIEGTDVTDAFKRGAEEVLRLAEIFGCKYAILKENSPSCGKGQVYNGDFSGVLIDGDGICAKLLSQKGIKVFGESQIDKLLEETRNE
ncbi:MAG: DUF523 domain-containing protein [Firmicutes bacterium]|nr:DUF523 domain-containing protein [Bacillota bacterium]